MGLQIRSHGLRGGRGSVPECLPRLTPWSWEVGRSEMTLNIRPHNVSFILLGTVLLWFGWLGFNGGSSFGANLRATMACWNPNITATFAATTWVMLDWRLAWKWSMVGWCSGTISGLVAATPASGYTTSWGSVVLGIATGTVCNHATKGGNPPTILLWHCTYICCL